jgi:phage/plasmid-associated DNA primase
MLYALIGRMLYDRGDIENWEVIPFIQGMGGSGKSTISKYVLKQFYEIAQIAELDNKLEKQFGLGPLAMKHPFITIGDELDEHCQLDLTHFLKMVSGETITAAVKGKTPIYLEWPSHLWFSGNQLPPWEDKGGALSRRLVTIFFKKMVLSQHKDMRLGEKIKQEIPNIIQKCVKAYLDLVNKHGHEEFWKFCPQYFNETKEELQEITNVVMKFMRSSEVIYDKSGVVLEKEFLLRLMKYADENGVKISGGALRNKNFSINSVIQQINDTYDDAEVEYGRKNVTQKSKQWKNVMALSGIRLKQEEDVNTELFNQDNEPKKLFAFENDFEIQNQLNKLNDAPKEPENAKSTVKPEDIDEDIIKNSKKTTYELTDENTQTTTLADGTKLNVDIEYGRYDENGDLLFINQV